MEIAAKGYFTLPDGSNTTDEANAELLKGMAPKTKRAKKGGDGADATKKAPKAKKPVAKKPTLASKRKSRLSGGAGKYAAAADSEEIIDLNAEDDEEESSGE